MNREYTKVCERERAEEKDTEKEGGKAEKFLTDQQWIRFTFMPSYYFIISLQPLQLLLHVHYWMDRKMKLSEKSHWETCFLTIQTLTHTHRFGIEVFSENILLKSAHLWRERGNLSPLFFNVCFRQIQFFMFSNKSWVLRPAKRLVSFIF